MISSFINTKAFFGLLFLGLAFTRDYCSIDKTGRIEIKSRHQSAFVLINI